DGFTRAHLMPRLRPPRRRELARRRGDVSLEVLQLREGVRPLAEEGPLKGRDRPLMSAPETRALRVSEVFHSLQGEGPSAGQPAHSVRRQGGDVGCSWCDSKYTWDAGGGGERSLEAVFAEARSLGKADLLVITGGEPLQHPGLAALIEGALGRWARIEVETS